MIQVSVTIPVYNAAAYLRQAVESALLQPQTREVILVEDLSTDDSWQVCQALAADDSRVHALRHPDGKNHGCSASRSLAVQHSCCNYIAFLDADDYFLAGRFNTAEALFAADPTLDGVYEAIEMHVEDPASLARWTSAGRDSSTLYTMSRRIPPQELFAAFVSGEAGFFSIDGLVVKRSVFDRTGYFDETLRLHMDEVFFIKLAAMAKLAPGSLEIPVARWRVHDHNRISAPRPNALIYSMRLAYWNTLWTWSKRALKSPEQNLIFAQLLKDARYRPRFNQPLPRRFAVLQQRLQLVLLPFRYPDVLGETLFWRAFLPHPGYWLARLTRARS